MEAALHGDAEEVAVLLRDGADMEAASHLGRTVLMLAAQSGHANVVKILLSAKADVDARCSTGLTALMFKNPSTASARGVNDHRSLSSIRYLFPPSHQPMSAVMCI